MLMIKVEVNEDASTDFIDVMPRTAPETHADCRLMSMKLAPGIRWLRGVFGCFGIDRYKKDHIFVKDESKEI